MANSAIGTPELESETAARHVTGRAPDLHSCAPMFACPGGGRIERRHMRKDEADASAAPQ